MAELIGRTMLAKELDRDGTWDWELGEEWEEGLDVIRAVHFHSDEVSPEQLSFLLELPNLEALGFCEDHVHTGETLDRLAQLVAARGIVDVELERPDHVPMLARFGALRRLRFADPMAFEEPAQLAPLAALTGLEELIARGREIDDDGLKHLAPLTGLRRLDLAHNPCADLTPLAGMTQLVELDLSETRVRDLAPLDGLKALRRLRLRGCPLGDDQLAALRGLELEALDVGGTRLSTAALRELCPGGWKGLFDEDAQVATARDADGDWDFRPVTTWTGDPAELRAVKLRDTWLNEPGGFDFLAFTTNLEHLDLTGMELRPQELERIAELTGLRALLLGSVGLDDQEGEREEAPSDIDDALAAKLLARLTRLEALDLAGSSLTGAGAALLAGLTGVRRLNLSGVPLAPLAGAIAGLPLEALEAQGLTVDDAVAAQLAPLKLRRLDLRGNPLTAAGLAELELSGLTELDLSGTQVADLSPLRGCAALRTLRLARAPLADGAAEVFAALTGLVELDLSHTQVDDAVVPALGQLPALRRLNLRATQVSEASLDALLALPLEQLDLSRIWLSDEAAARCADADADVTTSATAEQDELDRGPFAGLPQVPFTGALPGDAAGKAWRLAVPTYDADFPLELYVQRLLEDPAAGAVEALVLGSWDDAYDSPPTESIQLLVEHAAKLPRLRALCVGDMESEECEVSWIHHADLGPVLAAFPQLEVLKVRGSEGLSLGAPLAHPNLRELRIECGGLPASVLAQIASAQLPALEVLELYLGEEQYGWSDEGWAHLPPILSGKLFPKLRWLGLKDAEHQDRVASLVADAPVLAQLETLDLSLGTLGDAGAEALLASPGVARLQRLDLHWHYLSPEAQARLAALPPEVDLSEPREPDDWGDGELHRYIAVGE